MEKEQRQILAREFHQSGQCGYDYGTWEQVEKMGYECACFEIADIAIRALAAAPKRQCDCIHGDSDPNCKDPLCPNAATTPAASKPISSLSAEQLKTICREHEEGEPAAATPKPTA